MFQYFLPPTQKYFYSSCFAFKHRTITDIIAFCVFFLLSQSTFNRSHTKRAKLPCGWGQSCCSVCMQRISHRSRLCSYPCCHWPHTVSSCSFVSSVGSWVLTLKINQPKLTSHRKIPENSTVRVSQNLYACLNSALRYGLVVTQG